MISFYIIEKGVTMEYIGKGIGTLGLAAMVVGVAHFAPGAVSAVAIAACIIGVFIWAN
jgi:hypothetical protein